ncbi:MAG: efflux RND transporter periplasmic adaptor subunit [Verrucomicrobiota bacterium]|nr:efflux RND transporter periplasmic adaptor subunit [Verrucomicrobiota bacterium]
MRTFAFPLLGFALLLAACQRHGESTTAPSNDTPVQVRTALVEQPRVVQQLEVVATVRARQAASVAAQVTGPIEAITVELGDKVEAGQIIVRISEMEYRARLRQAEAQLKLAESRLKRQQSLFEKNATDASTLEDAEASATIAMELVEETRTVLGYCSIRAPFAGVVTAKLVNAGDLATPGRALLSIEAPNELRAEADVPSGLGAGLRVGMAMEVHPADGTTHLTGKLVELSPAVDPVSRTYLAKIELPANSGLRLGQFVRVGVPGGEHQPLLVPLSAVSRWGQMERVFVVKDNRAYLRLVKSGVQRDGKLELLSGISVGERVVVAADNLRDGQKLEVLQ